MRRIPKQDLLAVRHIPLWAREVITQVAEVHGVVTNVILMDFRHDKACVARREAIYKIKVKKPSLSSPQIGKWFDKNPVTILYSLARHSHETGAPRVSEYSLEKRLSRPSTGRPVGKPLKLTSEQEQEVHFRASSGENQRLLAKEFGVSQQKISIIKRAAQS